jgi:tetratricopeptide (TPR) repeat protein
MRVTALTIILVTLVAAAACDHESPPPFDARVAPLYDRAYAHPDSIELWIELARGCLDLWDDTRDAEILPMAEIAVHHAVAIDSTDAGALMVTAKLRMAQNRFDDAMVAMNRSLADDFTRTDAWGMLGNAQLAMGNYRNADSAYYVMYHQDANFESLLRIARATATLRSRDEALGYVDRAIANAALWDPTERRLAAAYVQQGELLFSGGFFDAALESAAHALDLQPQSIDALDLRARILQAEGLPTEAQLIVEKLVELSPHPRFKSDLARLWSLRHMKAQADSLLQVARVEYDSLYARYPSLARRDRIDFLLDSNMDVDAAVRSAYADTRVRKDIYGYALLARAYNAAGQHDRAWSVMGLALRQGTEDPRLLYLAARIARAAGLPERYEKFAARAREANPLIEKIYGPL